MCAEAKLPLERNLKTIHLRSGDQRTLDLFLTERPLEKSA